MLSAKVGPNFPGGGQLILEAASIPAKRLAQDGETFPRCVRSQREESNHSDKKLRNVCSPAELLDQDGGKPQGSSHECPPVTDSAESLEASTTAACAGDKISSLYNSEVTFSDSVPQKTTPKNGASDTDRNYALIPSQVPSDPVSLGGYNDVIMETAPSQGRNPEVLGVARDETCGVSHNVSSFGVENCKARTTADCEQTAHAKGRNNKSLYQTTLARGVPGYHEAEMSFRGEADLQRHLIDCDKHPGHEMFTPISSFGVQNLPEGYQDPDIVAYIRAQADLTVRVVSRYTSPDRPDNYAFSGNKGGTFLRTGTGFIQYVYKCEGRTDKPCPCPECKKSDSPRAQWAKIKIRTATHVVFDDVEAKNSVAELFFDNHEDRRNGKVKTVFGDNVRFGAIQGDWCDMRCVTHDLELCDFIKDAWGRWRWLESKVNEKFRGDEHQLAVVVSHPHGCNKQVSVGRWAERVVVGGSKGWENSVYSYDTPTCPGSSGAPVWLLGKVKWGGFFGRHPHSGRPLEGLNLSATGWDKIS